MRLKSHRRFEGRGNCLVHAVKFKLKYGGKIVCRWNTKRGVPSFRVLSGGYIYRFLPRERKAFALYFKGRTVKFRK